MHVNVDLSKIEIAMSEDYEWVERIGKTAYEICNDSARSRIKLNEQHTGFIMESNYTGDIDWAIEKHFDSIPIQTKTNISECTRRY